MSAASHANEIHSAIMHTDGGSRGNPGVAGSGTVISTADGTVIAALAYFVGKSATNNVAEYLGLVKGLEVARELGIKNLDVRMDSNLVVKQMSGEWKIKHADMKALAAEAQRIARDFDSVTYTWVPRAENKEADALANLAMDNGSTPETFVRKEISLPSVGEVSGTAVSSDNAGAAGNAGVADNTGTTEEPNGTVKAENVAESTESAVTDPGAGTGSAAHRTSAPATMAPLRLLLVRHGETADNEAGTMCGDDSAPLNEKGEAQAKRLAKLFAARGGVRAIFASPTTRTKQTAAAIAEALDLEVQVAAALKELDFGQWQGLSMADISTQHPKEFDAWLGHPDKACPGGESIADLSARVTAWREELASSLADPGSAAEPPELIGETPVNIVVVAHGGTIRELIRQALQAPLESTYRMQVDLGSLSVVEFYRDGGSVLRSLNR